MTVVWAKEALEKLSEIEKFIGRDSPEISNPDIREIIVKKYRIIYRIRKQSVEILTVFEGHRLIRIGKCAEENPDLTYDLIKEILVGIEELDRDEKSGYQFGRS